MAALDPFTFLFFAALFIGIVGLIVTKGAKRAGVAFAMVVIMLVAVLFGGLAFAGIPGVFQIPGTPAPSGGAVYSAQIQTTSSIDAASAGTAISGDGHSISWTLSQAEMGTLTLVELKVSITNANVGGGPYSLTASLSSCSKIDVSGSFEEMCAFNSNGNEAVTYTLTSSGTMTGSQPGTTFTSSDWATGASGILDASMGMDSTICGNAAANTDYSIVYNMGGVTITALLHVTS